MLPATTHYSTSIIQLIHFCFVRVAPHSTSQVFSSFREALSNRPCCVILPTRRNSLNQSRRCFISRQRNIAPPQRLGLRIRLRVPRANRPARLAEQRHCRAAGRAQHVSAFPSHRLFVRSLTFLHTPQARPVLACGVLRRGGCHSISCDRNRPWCPRMYRAQAIVLVVGRNCRSHGRTQLLCCHIASQGLLQKHTVTASRGIAAAAKFNRHPAGHSSS